MAIDARSVADCYGIGEAVKGAAYVSFEKEKALPGSPSVCTLAPEGWRIYDVRLVYVSPEEGTTPYICYI